MIACKNCEQKFEGNFCPACGQSASVQRFTAASILKEATSSIFQLNRGFAYTFLQLMVRPSEVVEAYLKGQRKTYYKPIAYVLIMSTLYYLTSRLLNYDNFILQVASGFLEGRADKKLQIPPIIDWLINNYPYANLLLLPLFALASFLSFLGRKRNYLEHIVLNAFIMGQQCVFYLLIGFLARLPDGYTFTMIPVFVSIIYLFFVYWNFFKGGKRVITLLRTLLTYLVYSIIFTVLLVLSARPVS
ncbi:MAG: DUF3667 domain-containing protein [Bacteroidota bacterium]